ncbi:MAG: hypothetical protein ACFB22_10810 [Rhodothalassiaceae bacterium]
MRLRLGHAAVVCLAAAVCACAGSAPQAQLTQAVREQLVEDYRTRAADRLAAKDWRGALEALAVLRTLSPNEPMIEQQWISVKARRDQAVTELTAKAEQALARGRERQAYDLFVQALILDPEQEAVRAALRVLDGRRAFKVQARRLGQDYNLLSIDDLDP